MVVLDATIVNIALPSAQADLGFADNDRVWIVTAYSLAFGSLLLLGGRLSDLVGRRTTFMIGLIGFATASALGGAAPNFTVLVTGRALQGVFAAVLAPSALSVLTTTFTVPKERSRAFGIFGALAGAGGAIGLLLGGWLTEHVDWRWTMYINVGFAIIALAGAIVFLSHARGKPQHLDLAGAALGGGGLFALVFGFSRAQPEGWGSPWTWAPLIVSALLLAGFVLRQRSAGSDGLLPLPVVADRNRGASFLALLIAGAGMFGAFLFGTYYMQVILGYSPFGTGLRFLPQVLVLALAAQLCTNIFLPRFGPKIMVPTGLLLAAIGMFSMTWVGLDSSFATHVLPGLMIMGAGVGTAMPAAIQTATLGIRDEFAGVGSAVVSTSQQVGGAVGTAILTTIAASTATNWVAANVTGAPSQIDLANAQIASYHAAFRTSTIMFAVGVIATVTLYRRRAAAPTST
jgi:EmrB/QacA subfamily drug resistance transporter